MLSVLFILAFIFGTFHYVNKAFSSLRLCPIRTKHDYDAIIVGGSIAGPAIAKALSDQGRSVILIERKLFTKPNRIVGELLQPGGISALKLIGMEQCANSIGMPCKGYVVRDDNNKQIEMSFRSGVQGVSFHFGDFVQKLREFLYTNCKGNVTMVEGTVTKILTEGHSFYEQAYGVEYTMAEDYCEPVNPFHSDPPRSSNTSCVTKTATAPLVIMCDGGLSRWMSRYQHYSPASGYHSNFTGIILKGARLPIEQKGAIFCGISSIVLSYRLDPNEVRVLVIYKYSKPLGSEKMSEWLLTEVAPTLPSGMREEFIRAASDPSNRQTLPITSYSPTFPAIKGVRWDRRPQQSEKSLTGGGMTCAFRDALSLADNLKGIAHMRVDDPIYAAIIQDRIQEAIVKYSRYRYRHSSAINLLSWALHAVFSVELLREHCFNYFARGGSCVAIPMELLGGLNSSLLDLFYHYYSVMLYGIISLMTESDVHTAKEDRPACYCEKIKNCITFFMSFSRLYAAAYLVSTFTIVMIRLAIQEFVSPWRFIDPTSIVGNISKQIKTHFYKYVPSSKNYKPVGL